VGEPAGSPHRADRRPGRRGSLRAVAETPAIRGTHPGHAPGRSLRSRLKPIRRVVRHPREVWHGTRGRCPVCEGPTIFVQLDGHPRNALHCLRCWSVPRRRALTAVLGERFPGWPAARVHEFAPNPDSQEWFARRCPGYGASHYWPDVPPGDTRDGIRCEDLGALTFADATIDLVISQDVFEHLPDPGAAAREIARVLVPGGAHVFTVPVFRDTTLVRARIGPGGDVVHELPAEYHGSPADPAGSLVFRDWGPDITDFLAAEAGLVTERIVIEDPRRGIVGGIQDVFVATRPA